MLEHLIKGLVVGVIIALPFGPAGILCLQRSLHSGVRVGLMSGMGVAAADAFYGAVAAFGLTFISSYLTSHHALLQFVGGILLVAIGIRMTVSGVEPRGHCSLTFHRLAGAFASLFVLTLTNPMTIVAFLAIFAGFGLGGPDTTLAQAGVLVAGVFAGSMVWWVLIAFGGRYLRDQLQSHLPQIKKICGLLILGIGVAAVLQIVYKYLH